MNNLLAVLRSTLATFYRTGIRRPLYTALNLLGLAFGIAVFLAISLFVQGETTFDRWMANPDEIYEVTTNRQIVREYVLNNAAPFVLDEVQKVLPGVRGTSIVANSLYIDQGETLSFDREFLVRGDFFSVFDFKFLYGDATTALAPDGVAVSDRFARSYFGRTDVVGQSLDVWDNMSDLDAGLSVPPERHRLKITAVFKDLPGNNTLKFRLLRPFPPERAARYGSLWSDWRVTHHEVFLRLSPVQAAKLNARFDDMVDRLGSAGMNAELQPGQSRHDHVHVRAKRYIDYHFERAHARLIVVTFGVMGLISFGLAFLNYINLATAIAGSRAREVGIRRTFGATKGALRRQFLAEALCLSGLALVIGVSLVELIMKPVAAMTGLPVAIDYGRDLPLLAGVGFSVLLFGLLAGLYPSVVLSNFRPAEVLGATRQATVSRFRSRMLHGLVFLQFTAVIALLTIVLGLASQVHHMRNSDVGYLRQGLLVTHSLRSRLLSDADIAAVTAQWARVPGVRFVSAGMAPGAVSNYYAVRVWDSAAPGRAVNGLQVQTAEGYFDAIGAKMLAGRPLQDGDAPDDPLFENFGDRPLSVNVVINWTTAQALGYVTPQAALGRDLILIRVRCRIVGVVADHRLGDSFNPIPPQVYVANTRAFQGQPTILRFDGVSRQALTDGLNAVWHAQGIRLPLVFRSARESQETYYRQDAQVTLLFGVAAGLVTLIGIIGLYGLAAFSTSARVPEIGLRKAMGATRWSVVRRLLFQFLKPVLMANIVALPVAYVVLDGWLKPFDHRVALSPWFFLAGSGISIAVAVLTVTGLAFAAAGKTPGKALRHE